ncbi:acyl-CoA dehydrogenase family protein [Streptomyces purpurascens]|uniref:acyl-CoA dehydrogenase family protein n=1 Tax=Streptomyces purpurascens TaxID=1924 RepID=UPI003C308970
MAPHAAAIANGDERTDGFPRQVFDALASAGVFRIPFPGEVGGDGLTHPAAATAAAIEELAYYSSSVAAVFDVHCILAGNALRQGTEEQQQRWLPKVAKGSVVGAFATTEPDASSDLPPQAVRTETGWVLNGHKRWISNSPVAAFVVVLARTGERLSMFIVDTALPGVEVGLADRKMGNRGQLTADIRFTDVHLSDDDLLGGAEGQGLRHALSTLTYGRVGIAAAGVGMAQAAPPLPCEPGFCAPKSLPRTGRLRPSRTMDPDDTQG